MPFLTQGKTNLNYILIIVILAIIVGGGILSYQYLLIPEEEISSPEIKVPQEISQEGKDKEDLLAKGIHPDAVIIKALEVSAQWKDNAISYSLEKAYLTPDIADLGPIRENKTYKDKSFLAFQLKYRPPIASVSSHYSCCSNSNRIILVKNRYLIRIKKSVKWKSVE